jgi:hypothetical protein
MLRHFVFLFLLFSISPISAQAIDYEPNSTALTLRIYAEVETNATTAAEYEAFLAETSAISLGSGMDLGERILLESAKTQNQWLAKAGEADDGITMRQAIEEGAYPLVILMGGPEQNNITAYTSRLRRPGFRC